MQISKKYKCNENLENDETFSDSVDLLRSLKT